MASLPTEEPEPLVSPRPGTEFDPGLDVVAQLVHREFDGSLDPRIVEECLHRVAARFADAPIRQFVPLLVRRYVREELLVRQARHRQIEHQPESTLSMPTDGAAPPQLPADGDTSRDTAGDVVWIAREVAPGA